MPDHDLEKLLGGFAADILTAEEKQQLYQAALHDQELFTALADEQTLKELFADPVVRRRILQSLQASSSATAGGSSSWSDWFHRPAGLAWAGGLTAAVFAVVLGTRVYQDSMKEADRSAGTEERKSAALPPSSPSVTQPPSPPTDEPLLNADKSVKQTAPLRKEVLPSKTARRESLTRAKPEERRVRDSSNDRSLQQHASSGPQRPAESMSKTPARSEQEVLAPGNQQPASTPPTMASLPTPKKLPAAPATSGQTSAPLSARSLFYGPEPRGQDKSTAGDSRRREKTESELELEQSLGQSELTPRSTSLAKSKHASPRQPVGIRYRLTQRDQSETFQEGATDTANHDVPQELTIESNQDGFLQLWKQVGSSNPELLFPITEADQARSKLMAYTGITIPIPTTLGILVIRFSRTVTIPSTTSDRRLLDDTSRRHLRESVMPDESSSSSPPTHYIVSLDPSLSEILVHLAPSQP